MTDDRDWSMSLNSTNAYFTNLAAIKTRHSNKNMAADVPSLTKASVMTPASGTMIHWFTNVAVVQDGNNNEVHAINW